MRIAKKYASDYRIYGEETARGKIRTRAVYVGSRFYLRYEGGKRGFLLSLFLPAVLLVLVWLLPMLPVSALVQNPIASVPYIMAAIPAVMLLFAFSSMHRSIDPAQREPNGLQRRERDSCSERARGASFFGIAFFGVSLVASLVLIILGEVKGIGAFDIMMMLCAFCGALLSLYLYIRARHLVFDEKKPPESKEPLC